MKLNTLDVEKFKQHIKEYFSVDRSEQFEDIRKNVEKGIRELSEKMRIRPEDFQRPITI